MFSFLNIFGIRNLVWIPKSINRFLEYKNYWKLHFENSTKFPLQKYQGIQIFTRKVKKFITYTLNCGLRFMKSSFSIFGIQKNLENFIMHFFWNLHLFFHKLANFRVKSCDIGHLRLKIFDFVKMHLPLLVASTSLSHQKPKYWPSNIFSQRYLEWRYFAQQYKLLSSRKSLRKKLKWSFFPGSESLYCFFMIMLLKNQQIQVQFFIFIFLCKINCVLGKQTLFEVIGKF